MSVYLFVYVVLFIFLCLPVCLSVWSEPLVTKSSHAAFDLFFTLEPAECHVRCTFFLPLPSG